MEAPMPVNARSNEIVGQVMHEHDLSQAWLADATGLSASFVSRVLDAQFSVPPDILKALWLRTKDQRIAQVALGETETVVVTIPPRTLSWQQTQNEAVGSIAHALSRIACIIPNDLRPAERRVLHDRIDSAIEALVTLRKHTAA